VLYSWRYVAPSTINSLYLAQQIFHLFLSYSVQFGNSAVGEFVLAYRKCLLIRTGYSMQFNLEVNIEKIKCVKIWLPEYKANL
jgi:hypothetical protein